jgi:hypothetical protein
MQGNGGSDKVVEWEGEAEEQHSVKEGGDELKGGKEPGEGGQCCEEVGKGGEE